MEMTSVFASTAVERRLSFAIQSRSYRQDAPKKADYRWSANTHESGNMLHRKAGCVFGNCQSLRVPSISHRLSRAIAMKCCMIVSILSLAVALTAAKTLAITIPSVLLHNHRLL